MLEFYFDDSGTHDSSRIAVWGGIVGHKQFVEELDSAWRQQLLLPCEGRSPIKSFSSGDLFAGRGEFRGYNQAERDRTRYLFRKLILDAKLTLLSFGVSVKDWDDIVKGAPRSILGSGERMIFGVAVRHGCDAAKRHDEPLSFLFDAGRQRPELASIVCAAIESASIDNALVNYRYAPVGEVPALQAADMVAHETYQYLCDYMNDPGASPTPHMQSLFGDAYDAQVGWYGRAEIISAAESLRDVFQAIDAMAAGQNEGK